MTPEQVLDPGCVVVSDGSIAAVSAAPPAGVRVHGDRGRDLPRA